MPVVEPDTGIVFCPAGNLDGELGIQPQGHRFVGSKLGARKEDPMGSVVGALD